jgi:hypothetical protein
MTAAAAAAYCGMSLSKFRRAFGSRVAAVRLSATGGFGGRPLYDRQALDRAINQLVAAPAATVAAVQEAALRATIEYQAPRRR